MCLECVTTEHSTVCKNYYRAMSANAHAYVLFLHAQVLNLFLAIHAAQILVPGVRQLHPLVQLSSVKFDLVIAMVGLQLVMSHGLL